MAIKFQYEMGFFGRSTKYSEKDYRSDYKIEKTKLFKSCIKVIEKLGYEIEEIDDDKLELFFQIKPKKIKNFGYQFIVKAVKSGSNKSTLIVNVQIELSSYGALGSLIEKKRDKEIADEIFDSIK